MAESQDTKFNELVAKKLSTNESQSLWIPVSKELDRPGGGPEAAMEYLDAQRQQLENRVENLLDEVKQGL